jgi:L-asparagine transporter-like permease
MIALGGVIGAGLFVGSGAVINQTGPAAVLSCLAAGVLVVLVMRMLGEMAVANPSTGSFADYARRSLGDWAGFTTGWLYWWFWVIVLAVEAVAGAEIIQRWIDIPIWASSLVLMLLLTLTNLASVKSYLLIAISELRMRARLERESPEKLKVRMWVYPWLTWLVIVAIVVVIGSMAFVDETRDQLWWSLGSLPSC